MEMLAMGIENWGQECPLSFQKVRWKHAMHLLRLLITGIEALRTGFIQVCVRRDRERLLSIKRGEISWEKVNQWR